jgi:predicted nucleic acid-binding protein
VEFLRRQLRDQSTLALAPQVLAEFVHVATDARRFQVPLPMARALERAQMWWEFREVHQVFPGPDSSRLFLRWMAEHGLGRKRLLDTQLAATYYSAGVSTIVTTNARDYAIFGCFEIEEP